MTPPRQGPPAAPPLLTAALIVRDESKHIEACLQSLAPHVDSIVVVDTGSIDDTAQRAEAAGAHVLEHTWVEDFSEARNRSLEAVEGPWALIIDADERLEVPDGSKLSAWLAERPQLDFARIPIRSETPSSTEEEWCIRLLRVDRGVRYRHLVHEQPIVDSRTGDDAPCSIRHLGHADGDAKARQERYLAMLSTLPEDDPHRILFTVRTLVSLGRWEEVELWATRWAALGRSGPEDARVHFHAAVAASNRWSMEDSHRWVQLGLARYPDHPDLLLVATALSAKRFLGGLSAVEDPEHPLHRGAGETKRWREAAEAFLRALEQG
jgi:hypothetical protein